MLIACAAFLAAAGVRAEEGGLVRGIAITAAQIEPQLIEARRWFHEHPELSNRENATGLEIARRLEGMGYEVQTGVAGFGVVAILRGGLPGPVVAWRSDIDALPIEEQVDVPCRRFPPARSMHGAHS